MQEITKENFTDKYCVNNTAANALAPIGSTIKLKGSRDGNNYTIIKLEDGNCWMQENLALPGGTTLTPDDSDVSSNWTLPASATSWDTSNYQAAQMMDGASVTVNSGSVGDGKGWQTSYGNYYSWCAATAESCKLNRTGSPITSGQAAESICPKNWHLPAGDTNGEFYNLFGNHGTNLGSSDQIRFKNVQASPYSFPAAGYVNTNAQLYDSGIYGLYWSSTPSPVVHLAYYLSFYNTDFDPGTYGNDRYRGYSVRCVAN